MMSEEIKYWENFLTTVDYLSVRTEKDYEFFQRIRKLIDSHIDRLKTVIKVNGNDYKLYSLNNDSDKNFLYYYFKGITEDIFNCPCSKCDLRDLCVSGQEYCKDVGGNSIYLNYINVLHFMRDFSKIYGY